MDFDWETERRLGATLLVTNQSAFSRAQNDDQAR